jgi:hypothetical protein
MGKGHRKGWKKEELNRLAKRQSREESPSVESPHQNTNKPVSQRLLGFIEQPLFLAPVGTLGGLVGMFLFTPLLIVCGFCILLAFHRAKVVEGETRLFQIAAYSLLFALTTGGLYGMRILIKKKVPSFPTSEELRQIVTKAVSDALSKRTPVTEIRNVPSKTDREHGLEQPAFREDIKDITVALGGDPESGNYGMATTESIERLRREGGKSSRAFNFFGYRPVEIHLEGEKLSLSFRVWAGEGESPIEIKDNRFTVRPVNWDLNSTATALEVVNQANNPVFQMVRRRTSVLIINGIFPLPDGGVIIATPHGARAVKPPPQSPEEYKLKPIFKYPSWKYPGVYADSH